ncbi:MAG: TonB-dependent receptor [Gemmatimonadales bacterium]
MRPRLRIASAILPALAIATSAATEQAGAQSSCAPASRASMSASSDESSILSRRVSLHGRGVSLRDALDRLAAAARIRLSYSAELLNLSSPVCLEYESATVSQVLDDLLQNAPVRPVVLGIDQIVLTPSTNHAIQPAEQAPLMKQVGLLDRVVVTGSAVGASQRALPIALDVVSGQQLAQRGASSLSGALDGVVPGLWLWEQSPLSLLARYGSIRGASSFGVSYPKVYVDGIEVANSLLVTHLDPESVSRVEVIRGPQGAALYGADAISGVMNIITRQDGTEGGAARAELRSEGGTTASDYSASSVLAQSHSLSLRTGTGIRSARAGMTVTTIGPFIPGASSQQIAANGGLRFVNPRSVISGTFRFFAQDARTPTSPVLAGIDLWSPSAVAYRQGLILRRSEFGPGPGGDSIARHRMDSLSRLVVLDSSDRQSVRQYTLGVSGTFAQSDRWTHSAVVGIDGYTLRSAAILDGAFPTALDSALRAATGEAIRTTARASAVGQFGDPQQSSATVTLAAEHSFVRDETATLNPFAPQQPLRPGERTSLVETRSNAGLIGQVSASFRESLFLSGGLRVERNTGLSGLGDLSALPMLGVSAVHSFPFGTVKLRSAYGKGIRPPQTSSRAGTLMGLSGNVTPEQQSGIEAGADLFIGKFIAVHATRFDQRASGLIQPVSVYSAAAASDSLPHYRRIMYQLQNVGEITNRGWELQGTLGNGPWSIGTTFSQVDSRVTKLAARYTGDLKPGDRMLEVPARTFGVNAGYVQSKWSMSWRLSRASDWINYDRLALLSAFASQSHDLSEFVGPELRSYWRTYDGVTRVGGRVGVSLVRGMTFTLDGENLLDEQRGEPDNVTVLPGRTLSAGLRVRF